MSIAAGANFWRRDVRIDSRMFHATDDLRIKWTKVVLPPVFLEEELPMTDAASATVFESRNAIRKVLAGDRQAAGRGGGALLDSRHQGGARIRQAG